MFLSSNKNLLIFLIGMPAVGKTYWGNKIAREYTLPFIDLDAFIEQREQATITDLFARFGEDGFREKENKYLKQAINGNPGSAIIACGGGTPCFSDNISLLKAAGVVIYLRADIAILLENIKNRAENRPLFSKKPDIVAYLENLLKIRAPIFEQAHYVLDAKNLSLVAFDKIISLCTNQQ